MPVSPRVRGRQGLAAHHTTARGLACRSVCRQPVELAASGGAGLGARSACARSIGVTVAYLPGIDSTRREILEFHMVLCIVAG